MLELDDENADLSLHKEELPLDRSANKILPPRWHIAKDLGYNPILAQRHRHNILHIGHPLKNNLTNEPRAVLQARNPSPIYKKIPELQHSPS